MAYQAFLPPPPMKYNINMRQAAYTVVVARATANLTAAIFSSVHSILPRQGKVVSIVVHFVLRPRRRVKPRRGYPP
jgi:hypothetical protein